MWRRDWYPGEAEIRHCLRVVKETGLRKVPERILMTSVQPDEATRQESGNGVDLLDVC